MSNELNKLFLQVQSALQKAEKVIIVMHQRPDGDALGSSLALSHYCDAENIPHDIFCIHDAPNHFTFLPHIDRIQTDPKLLTHGDHDMLVSLDSGDLVYAGIHEHLGMRRKEAHTIINIDHHATNTHYGDINVVDPKASSTSEMMYHFMQATGQEIDHRMATCMLTGIITDTGGFSNMATTSSSLTVASDLLLRGARIWDIQTKTLKNKPIQALQVWGVALSRLTRHESGVVSTVLTRNDLRAHNANPEHIEGMANFLNSLEDAKAVFVISELEEGKIKISMRTTQDGIDVSRLAKKFGGGGHQKAAGFSISSHIMRGKKGFHIV